MASGKKILVVDDEKDIQIYLSKLLEENGYTVTTAADGEEAHEAVKAQKPDLITLDMSMPNKSGVRFYREIKENPDLATIPVVVITGVTGQGGSDDTKKFLSTRGSIPPPAGFVAKPIDAVEVIDTIDKLLSKEKATI